MKHLRLNPPPRAFAFPFCHDGELNSSLIVLPSISVLLQEFNASLASSAVAKSTNAYLCGEEDSSQSGSNKGFLEASRLQCQPGGQKKGTTYPLGLPWLFCGTLMEAAFLNTSWRVSSVAAYERLLTISVFDSPVGRSQCC